MLSEITVDRQAIEGVLRQALAASAADETEALISVSDSALTRFTHNFVHENMTEINHELSVRAVFGKRVGVASTSRFTSDGIAEVVKRAADIARFSPDDEHFPGLPADTGPLSDELSLAYDAKSANLSPDARADAVAQIARVMFENNLHAAGYVSSRSHAIAVANSKGVQRFFRSTDAGINIKAIGDNSSGYAESFSRRFADLHPTDLAERAADKANQGRDPIELEPGRYTVILEPPAFHEFLGYLSWIGFGAQPFDDGSSFMSGRLGEKIVGENVTIRDDFSDPLSDGIPFDFEGVPRQPVKLIENGVARDVVYDSYYAAKLRHPNTGHALPAPNSYGPLPLNIVIEPGVQTLDELIANTRQGVLVSRTWYIRLVDQKKTIITGMTRDGLFKIANGKVTRGLKNMRFNDSIVDALSRCELASGLVRSDSHVLPAVKIEGFHFTSGTEF